MGLRSTSDHGVLDYVLGLLTIGAPWLLGFAHGGSETWVLVVVGALGIASSLLTDYEWGAWRQLGLRLHLVLDGFRGLFLVLSPWLFDFAAAVWVPHAVIGFLVLVAAALTWNEPLEDLRYAVASRHDRSESRP